VSVTTVTATGTAAVDSLEVAFDVMTPIDLSLIFTGWGPLPAITHVEEQSGPWDHVGVHRRPQFADGGSAMERMTHYLRPGYFAYEVTGFTNALRLVVEHARGEWTFTPDLDGGVAVRWSYHFTAKPGRGALVRLLIGPMWKQYMRKGLAASIREAERTAGPGTSSMD
jgi:Polyketide cyclase / dehydrase and lipid transport